MKKTLIIIVVVLALIVLSVIGTYNGLVNAEVTVDEKWSQVETVYQRRVDLIPQLVATVQGSADFEKSTLENVTNARTQWLGAGSVNEKVQAATAMDSALARLLVTVENYPNIKSTENFLSLQSQLEGSENRITVERKRYNEAVSVYNKYIRVFPKNLIAGLFGFSPRDFFESAEGADKAPEINFDFS